MKTIMKNLIKKATVAVCLLFSVSAAQAELIEYCDYDAAMGTFSDAVQECTLVTSETRTLENGWYAVMGEVTIPEGANLTVNGTAHLILCDGAKLSINKPAMRCAAVRTTGATLVVYGQTLGSGELWTDALNEGAGIGGDSKCDGGTLTINGGKVTAIGGEGGAGIGGGLWGAGGSVTINGGIVTAQGGEEVIDSEFDYNNGAPGIGRGSLGRAGTVIINGGTVSAQGGLSYDGMVVDIVGSDANGAVTIRNGRIKAGNIQGGIQISGGIFSNPIQENWCASHFVPSVNRDPATRTDYPFTVVPAQVVTIGAHPKTTAFWTSGDDTEEKMIEGVSFTVPNGLENVVVHFAANSDYVLEGEAMVNLGTVTDDIVFGKGNEYALPRAYSAFGDISYLDWNGSQMINAVVSKYDYTLVTATTEEMTDGWYVVARDVERATIKVAGVVNLVVADGCELKVSGRSYDLPGIDVVGSNKLSVYGQMNGTGKVTANGGELCAGIGARGSLNGTLTINGGIVSAQGGSSGAGIGGGWGGLGGTVTIIDGIVTAIGGWGATGIGGGYNSNGGGTVTIRGGAVKTQAGEQGKYEISGTVSISGGIFWKEPEDGWVASDCIVTENVDDATKEAYPYKVLPPHVVTVGTLSHLTVKWTSGDGSETHTVEDGAFRVPYGTENVKVIFTANPGYVLKDGPIVVVELGTVTKDIKFGSGGDYKVPTSYLAPVKYVDADGVVREKANGEFTKVSSSTKKLANGKWYAVIDNVTLTNNLTVEGTAHLILCDWASLTVKNVADNTAAISVGGGASLTIYGQTANTGSLEVKGGGYAAGIGGGYNGDCGAIKICGGMVKTQGGNYGAGIGSGTSGKGGSVTITGGSVTANGGASAAGIGNGYKGSGSIINIATSLVVKADGNNPPTTVISNDGSDLAGSLAGKQYVTVTKDIFNITANQDPEHKTHYYSTFYSSTNAYKVPEDVTAYTGVVNGDVLKLTSIADGIIPADEAVILRLTTADNTATKQQFALTATTTTATKSDDNALTGTDVAIDALGANDYALSLGHNGVGFYLWKNQPISAHKAYLTLTDPSIKALIFKFEEESTTGMTPSNSPGEMPPSNSPRGGEPVAYDVTGVRVGNNYKGIVIKNGKKVIR